MIKSIKTTSVQNRRKFDQTFKREAVQNWLNSGKSAQVVGEELGINSNPRPLQAAGSTLPSFWFEWNHKEDRRGNYAQCNDEARSINPLAESPAHGNSDKGQCRHSEADIDRLPEVRQALPTCSERRQHQNDPDAKWNDEREQFPIGPADAFAPKKEDGCCQRRSHNSVCRPDQKQGANGFHARYSRRTAALTGARPVSFDADAERRPGVQCRAGVRLHGWTPPEFCEDAISLTISSTLVGEP